tara:strand:+ start:89 stop:349 length:261 start_codon:yes stop_codon:yes gene_type:complete
MRKYFKFFTYYSLCLVDSLINFLSCVVGCYPGFQLGEDFLFAVEYRNAGSVITSSVETREKKAQEAENVMRSAKENIEDTIHGQRS